MGLVSDHIQRELDEWKDDNNIKISARESYLIMDCLNFTIAQMKNQDIEYLYANYDKNEISEVAKKFGDLNLKNRW